LAVSRTSNRHGGTAESRQSAAHLSIVAHLPKKVTFVLACFPAYITSHHYGPPVVLDMTPQNTLAAPIQEDASH